MNEAKAIEGCKKQDRISQKYLFDTYSDGMLMVCLRYVRALHDAEEIMLNGFYSFFRAIAGFEYRGPGSVGGYLKKIMVNECLMFLRRKSALSMSAEDHAVDVPADDGQLARMAAGEILRLVMQLPDGYRTVFNLFVIEGYSHKEISALLGIAEGTSKSQLNKARMLLQKVLKETVI